VQTPGWDIVGVVIQYAKPLRSISAVLKGDGLGQVLQVGPALGGCDDDFFQRLVRGVGRWRSASTAETMSASVFFRAGMHGWSQAATGSYYDSWPLPCAKYSYWQILV